MCHKQYLSIYNHPITATLNEQINYIWEGREKRKHGETHHKDGFGVQQSTLKPALVPRVHFPIVFTNSLFWRRKKAIWKLVTIKPTIFVTIFIQHVMNQLQKLFQMHFEKLIKLYGIFSSGIRAVFEVGEIFELYSIQLVKCIDCSSFMNQQGGDTRTDTLLPF